MSIGYEDMHSNDFNNYMCGTYAFKLEEGGKAVRAYSHLGIADDYEADAHNSTCTMRECMEGDHQRINVGEMFSSPEWITHRFPTGYLSVNNNTRLIRIALEPWERRMRKGLDFGSLRMMSIIEIGRNPKLSPKLVHRIRTFGGGTPDTLQLLDGICQQLRLGQTTSFGGLITASQAKARAVKAVTNLLSNPVSTALAINPELAIIKPVGKTQQGTVLNNGSVIGTVEMGEELVFTSPVLRDYATRDLRIVARRGLKSLINRTITSNIIWQY